MKKIFLMMVALGMLTTASAQPAPKADSGKKSGVVIKDVRKSVVKLGVKAGVNFASMSSYDKVDLGLKSGTSFQAGALLSARFGKRTKASDPGTGSFGAQVEFLYMQNSIKNDYADAIKLNYFAAPILGKWYFLPDFNVEAGICIATMLSSSPDMIEVTRDGLSIAKIPTGKFKGFDFRPTVGLAYTVGNTGLGLGARYYFGTSDLAKDFPCKVNTIEASVSYSFDLFKF